jgi:glucose/arabinose dehydrogenase/cytochrome c551/c552
MNRLPVQITNAISLLLCIFFLTACSKRSGKAKILVFTKTAGYHHESIPDGVAAIEKLGSQNNFDVDTTSNAEWFTDDTLKKYSSVIFLSTTSDVLNNYQEADFERYIQSGGGYVGIHAAADAEYDWGWYGRLVGGYFLTHPGIMDSFPNVQEAVLNVVDQNNEATKHLPKQWKRTDEYYSYKKLNKDVKVLMTIDESSYKIGVKMDYHPMTWYHEYDGGRAFYTALGHTKESFHEENFLKLLLGGIKYAIGDNKELDYGKAKTARVPEENRFAKTVLARGQFFEPTEMTILPNLDILIAQRRGEILLYKNGDSAVKKAGFLSVYFKTNTPGVNAEEGLLGLKADPDFDKNHYVYIFYSPIDTSVNRLSRFKFENDSIVPSSEKIVLQFYSQREICCHTGGSIAFGKDKLLYLSTGDNSTPFNEPNQPYVNNGYAPLDDRPGHEQYDARRTSGNANDLRGKILRIRINDDGSYDIPEGNLYPKGTPGTKPEIYVQGNRNPYRISVDQKNGFLYWGEVGPDANGDSLDVRGPRGYDELNQARKAGFFGWPLFVGNNYPYRNYDYATGKSSASFDPKKPVNNSRNNTGIKELPPVQPAFIWYPYAPSPDFPQVGTGGRNAMAGPVYYTDMFPKDTRLPDYYNNKLFIYDWMRGWIKAVTMQPNGDFDKMEPFMPQTKLNSLIDMETGPDGKLYLLEYGSGWFSQNADAALSRIDFNGGNRAPSIAAISVDKTSGALPFKVVATVTASDPERDALTYEWDLGNGEKKETKEPRLEYTYNKIGDYKISVMVKDDENATAKSDAISVYAGNDAPVVTIDVVGNESFYFPGKPVVYTTSVTDKNDTSVARDLKNVFITADYVEGSDKAGASMGHQIVSDVMMGRSLVQSLDCKSCHKEAEKSIGPAYVNVAKKYQAQPNAITYLVNKVIKGGSGVWGETVMPAHPTLTETDARKMISWVLTLAGGANAQKSLPVKGSVNPTLNKKPMDNGMLILSASYTDKGSAGTKPLMGSTAVVLRSNKMSGANAHNLNGYTTMTYNGLFLLMVPKAEASFSLDSIDLTNVNQVAITFGWDKPPKFGYTFEAHLDGPGGKKIGEAKLPAGMKNVKGPGGFGSTTISINLVPVTDGKQHNLYLVSRPLNTAEEGTLIIVGTEFKSK